MTPVYIFCMNAVTPERPSDEEQLNKLLGELFESHDCGSVDCCFPAHTGRLMELLRRKDSRPAHPRRGVFPTGRAAG